MNNPVDEQARAAVEPTVADPEYAELLGFELDGVIEDVEHGNGFDDVCLETIKRVRAALGSTPVAVDQPSEPASPVGGGEQTAERDELAKKLVELADELDSELDNGAKWTKAQHTCASVGGALRDVAKKVDEQIYQLLRALREATEGETHMGEPVIPDQIKRFETWALEMERLTMTGEGQFNNKKTWAAWRAALSVPQREPAEPSSDYDLPTTKYIKAKEALDDHE